MTIDLASIELEAAWLVNLVRTTNNSALLIAHLRAGKEVTPLLADLIADILEGTFKAKPRTMTAVQIAQKFKLTRIVIAAEIDDWKAFLANPSSDWEEVEEWLKRNDIEGPLDERHQIVSAAKRIVARLHNLKDSQLDEVLYPRKARPLKRR